MPISSTTDGLPAGFPYRLRNCRRDRQGGFTLMEVVLAMAIMALLAALGLPFLRPNSGVTALRSKTFEVVALLRSERNAALLSGTTSTVLVDVQAGTIRSARSSTRIDVPASISMHLLPERLAGIQFFPDGRASATRLMLRSGDAITAVDVNGLTAAVNASDGAR